MKGLDYYDLPALLNNYTANVIKSVECVEKKLLEKARFINKKMGSADLQTLSRLNDEKKFVEEVADLMDHMSHLMELMQKTVSETNSDFWDHAHRGGELKEEIRLHKETIQILYAQRDLPWVVIDKLRMKDNTPCKAPEKLESVRTNWAEADKRIADIKNFLKKTFLFKSFILILYR